MASKYLVLLPRANPKNNGRKAQNEDKVPFRPLLPLALRKKVTGKGDKMSKSVCIQEMFVLFSCLQQNEYDDRVCSKEINQFQKCYVDSTNNHFSMKEMAHKGILVPGERKMTHRQVNKLLENYPPPRIPY